MSDLSKLDNIFGVKKTSETNINTQSSNPLDNIFAKRKTKTVGLSTVKETPAPVLSEKEIKKQQTLNKVKEVLAPYKDTRSLITKIGEKIDKATERPDYETKPASTSAWKNTLRELPSALIENLVPGVGAIRNEPEVASTIKPMDMVKEIPGVVLDTAKEFVKAPIRGAIELPSFLTAGEYSPEIKFNIPFLGEIKNADARIAERIANGETPTSGMIIGEKSSALLDSLFLVSLAVKPFMARPKTVATGVKLDSGALPSGAEVTGPKSFRLYTGPKSSATSVPKESLVKLEQSGVKFKSGYNPDYPTYFRTTQMADGSLRGEIIQMRPSYFDIIKSKFNGDLTKADPAEVKVVHETKTTPDALAKGVENLTPEQTVRNHILEARDVVREAPDAIKADPSGFLLQTKKNIVDGLKAQGQGNIATKIDAINTGNLSSLSELESSITQILKPSPAVIPPTIQPIIPVSVPTPKVDISKLDNIFGTNNKIQTEQSSIEKAKEDIRLAKEDMKNAPDTTDSESVKTKADYQKYIDETQAWIDKKTQSKTTGKIVEAPDYVVPKEEEQELKVQYHGTQDGEALKQAIQEGTVRVSESGIMGKGFYLAPSEDIADMFGREIAVKDAQGKQLYRTRSGKKPDIIPIDISGLKIKVVEFGKQDYYDFLDKNKLSADQWNEQLQKQGYDGLYLAGRGEAIIFDPKKITMTETPPQEAKTAPETSADIPPEIDAELEARATVEWENDPQYGEKVGELADQVSTLENKLKETKIKTEKAVLQKQIDNLNNQIGKINDSFANKWQDIANKENSTETKNKLAGKKLTIEKGALDDIPVYDTKGNYQGKVSERKGLNLSPKFIEETKQIKKNVDIGKEIGMKIIEKKEGLNKIISSIKDIPMIFKNIRNMPNEELHIVFVDATGKILSTEITKGEDPHKVKQGNVDIIVSNLKDKIKELGAVEIYYVHNHPEMAPGREMAFGFTSISEPSLPDEWTFRRVASKVPELKGSVILSKDEASFLTMDKNNTDVVIKTEKVDYGGTKKTTMKNGDIPNNELPKLRERLDSIIEGIEGDTFTADRLSYLKNNLQDMSGSDFVSNLTKVKNEIESDNFTRENIDSLLKYIKDSISNRKTKNALGQPVIGQKAKSLPQAQMSFDERQMREAMYEDIKSNKKASPLSKLINDLISGDKKIGVSKTLSGEQQKLLEGYGYFKFFKDDSSLQKLDQVAEDLKNQGVDIQEPNDIIEALKNEIDKRKLPAYSGGSANANIGMFEDDIPVQAGKLEEVNPIEMPEMVDLARELLGQVPKIRRSMGFKLGYFKPTYKGNGQIVLKAGLFDPKQYTPDQVAKVLAHELGHLVDYLPDQTLKRGNLLGRLLSLNDFRKNTFQDLMTTNKELRDEMYALSKEWRPFDEEKSSQNYIKYRKSGREIYADNISALLNSPGYVETKAPTFYRTFFEELDRKPQVRDAYFELQSLLSGDKELLTAKRREGVKQMFDDGEYKSGELQKKKEAEKKGRLGSMFSRLKFDVVSKNYPLIDRVKQLEKRGIKVNPDDNPVYYLEERNYLGGKIKAILSRDFDPIYKRLTDAGISWEDFGEALFYKRIIDGDRSKVANPRGITVDVAKTLYEDVQKNLGDKVKILEESLTDFRNKMMNIAEEAYKEGLYSAELYQQMKDNPTYATFQVIDHLEDGLTSKVYKSIGTLKDITNPATATIEKMIKTVQAIERNKVNKATVDFLKKDFSDEIKPAKSVFNGKSKSFIDSKKFDEELVTFMRNGKAEGYYVDPYIAKTLNNESIGQNLALVQGLRFMNSNLYRPLFITYNLGFQSFNLLRDFTRFWKNMPPEIIGKYDLNNPDKVITVKKKNFTLWMAIKRYKEASGVAKVRAFGLSQNPTPADLEAQKLIEKLEMDRVLSITMNDLLAGESSQDKQIDKVLSKYGINPIKNVDQNSLFKYGGKLLNIVKELGDLIETLPKVAGYYELASRGPITKEDASFIRRKIGSPDFQDGGYAKPITNELFLFSNSILQGMRADLEVMTEPKTRSGYWWKTAKLTFLPKLLMFAASIGLFGKYIKDMMDSASEYDKTNYMIIPLGKDKNDKAVYVRLPQDETGRFLGGVFWKVLNAGRNDQGIGKDVTDVISFFGGQIPSITPTIDSISATMQYVSGQNPYDYFRSRNIMSDDVYNAGGWEAAKAFLGWQFQQMGGGVFGNFFNGSQTPTDKSIPEKIFTAPVVSNILGRFIKVSNYGKAEVYRQIADEYKRVDANQRIEEKDIANKYAKMVSSGEKTAVEANNQMIQDVFNGEPKTEDDIAKAKRIVNRFNLNMIRGEQDPLINAITFAVSNKEKVAILQKAKETMEINVFVSLLKAMYNDKIIGDTVLEGLSNEK